jgi:hypothetical protein
MLVQNKITEIPTQIKECMGCQKPVVKFFFKGEFVCMDTRIRVECHNKGLLGGRKYTKDEINKFKAGTTAKHFIPYEQDSRTGFLVRKEIKAIEQTKVSIILKQLSWSGE